MIHGTRARQGSQAATRRGDGRSLRQVASESLSESPNAICAKVDAGVHLANLNFPAELAAY